MAAKTSQLARLLMTNNRDARAFAQEVSNRVGQSVRYAEIMKALRNEPESDPEIQAAVDFLREKPEIWASKSTLSQREQVSKFELFLQRLDEELGQSMGAAEQTGQKPNTEALDRKGATSLKQEPENKGQTNRFHRSSQYARALNKVAYWRGSERDMLAITTYLQQRSDNALPSLLIYQWLASLTEPLESPEDAYDHVLGWLIAQVKGLDATERDEIKALIQQEADGARKRAMITAVQNAARSLTKRSQDGERLMHFIAQVKEAEARSHSGSGVSGPERKTIGRKAPAAERSALEVLDPANQDSQGVAIYRKLVTALPEEALRISEVDNFVATLKRIQYSNLFWPYLKLLAMRRPPTVRDLTYLATISRWPGTSRALLLPALRYGQEWYSSADAVGFALPKSQTTYENGLQSRMDTVGNLESLAAQCWLDIMSSERRYEVPSAGRAVILANDEISRLTDLKSLRFVQEGARAPAVFIQFAFGDGKLIGMAKVNKDGMLEGINQLYSDYWSKALIRAIALSYYRDLVLPGEIIEIVMEAQSQGQKSPRRSASERSKSQSRGQLPRRPASPKRQTNSLEEWYEAQETVRKHAVTGHTRWVGDRFRANPEKVAQARMAGVTLKRGYTWVLEHERGNPTSHLPVPLDGVDLTQRTLFSPPQRATKSLSEALSDARSIFDVDRNDRDMSGG